MEKLAQRKDKGWENIPDWARDKIKEKIEKEIRRHIKDKYGDEVLKDLDYIKDNLEESIGWGQAL